MPSARSKGPVRQTQVVTTYGVGAMVPEADESFMVAGLDFWPTRRPDVHEPRLERRLRVQGFVQPPAAPDTGVPVTRFPKMYWCPNCHRLDRYDFFSIGLGSRCSRCDVRLVPSRFVIACTNGHLSDFPYSAWVHHDRPHPQGALVELYIKAGGTSAALRDIVIRCACGSSRTMEGAFGREAMKGLLKCAGERPWLDDREACDLTPRTLQRGASNVHFPIVRSAISIPPWSEGAFKLLNAYWEVLKAVPEDALLATLTAMKIAEGTEYSAQDLVKAVAQRKSDLRDEAPEESETAFREQEYQALRSGRPEVGPDQDFVCEAVAQSDDLAPWLAQVMVVKRLREVRALEAFTRVLPPEPGDPPERRAPISARPTRWFPGIEVQGEGVFLRLREEALAEWEGRGPVLARSQAIQARYAAKCAVHGQRPERAITPRLLLIHTLAHLLIEQWALDAGYPTASLRERLYVSDTMAGLLVYTATSSAAGSLGGLVAQARPERLAGSFRDGMARASWCSSDPLCIETTASGTDSLNGAACHACILLPEVSCEESNVFLDRAMLVGTPEAPHIGFFSAMREEDG